MSHPQAYHTSCREGLGGHSGFQFNAASPRIAHEQLSALASAHAGYHPPRDCALEPTAEQLRSFPVTLKYRPVEGVGPALSRTAYVGREFRGRDGEPDAGRFGNYFSHIVLGNGEDDPFDGLLPIELWDAPHWSTTESATRELPELDVLTPGPNDIERTLASFDESRREWLGAALDAALAALAGGPRVVLVEPDVERAAAWVAWTSFALPPGLAGKLTFSTFDGQPRYAQDLRMCITTPGCDVGFADYELGRDVVLLSPLAGGAPPRTSLYARVAANLAELGAEAVARTTRALRGAPEHWGAELAVLSGRVELAHGEGEIVSLLDMLCDLAAQGSWELACATAKALPAEPHGEAIVLGWGCVYTRAREATAEAAQELVDGALVRLLQVIGGLPDALPAIASDTPTRPSTGRLAAWLELLQAERDGARRAALVSDGLCLGLVGCNAALDRRVAGSIRAAIADQRMLATFAALAEDISCAGVVEDVMCGLAREAFADERLLERLRSVIAQPRLRGRSERLAARAASFEERAVWERLRIEHERSALPQALATLVPMSDVPGGAVAIARLFGRDGPSGSDEQAMLLKAYRRAGLAPTVEDVERALATLAELSLTTVERGRALVDVLHAVAPEQVKDDHLYRTWVAAVKAPPRARFAAWADWVAGVDFPQLSNKRNNELWELAGQVCARCLEQPDAEGAAGSRAAPEGRPRASEVRPPAPTKRTRVPASPPRGLAPELTGPVPDYAYGVGRLAQAFKQYWPETFKQYWPEFAAVGLAREIAAREDPSRLVANAFVTWRGLPPAAGDLLENALPAAVADMSSRRLQAVAELLPPREEARWLRWLESHRTKGAVGKTVGRLLKGEGKPR